MAEDDPEVLWAPRTIGEGASLEYQFGPLTFWLRRADLDFALSVRRDASEEIRCAFSERHPPADVKASDRFAYDKELGAVQALPIMPDRSLVVRPENPLKVLSGQQTLFFVSIPLTIQLQLLGANAPITVAELPTTVLSNTWFGDTMGGEMCYSLKTTAKHRLEALTRRQWRAICPVTLINRSDKNLELQRMCVQTKHLGCFQGERFLWTNAIEVTHRPDRDEFQVQFGETPPAFEKIHRQMSEPRDPVRKSFLRRGFATFRFPGFF